MNQKLRRSWGGVVFGLIFAMLGVVGFYVLTVKTIYEQLASADWVEIHAQIIDLKLKKTYNSDSVSYALKGEYHYRIEGKRYVSSRISLIKGSNDFLSNLHDRLSYNRSINKVIAFVNPDNPNQAVLDRTFEWSSPIGGVFFLALFVGFGGFFVKRSWQGKNGYERYSQVEGQGIVSSDRTRHRLFVFIGGVLFAISIPILFDLPNELAEENYEILIALIFPIIGILFLWLGWRQRQQYLRFGVTELYLEPINPNIGGSLGAWFFIKAHKFFNLPQTLPEILVTVQCIKIYQSGNKTRRTSEWQLTVPAYLKHSAEGIKAMIKIELPADCRPTKQYRNSVGFDWQVSAEADFSAFGAGKFERTWKIYVAPESEAVKTDSSEISIPQTFLNKVDSDIKKQANESVLQQIEVKESDDLIQIKSHPARNLGICLIIAFSGLIFTAMGFVFLNYYWLPGYGAILLGMGMFTGCVFSIGKSIDTQVDTNKKLIRSERFCYGIRFQKHECALINPDQFSILKTGTVTTGDAITRDSTKKYYAVYVECNDKKIRVAEYIEGQRAAQALVNNLVNKVFDSNDRENSTD